MEEGREPGAVEEVGNWLCWGGGRMGLGIRRVVRMWAGDDIRVEGEVASMVESVKSGKNGRLLEGRAGIREVGTHGRAHPA